MEAAEEGAPSQRRRLRFNGGSQKQELTVNSNYQQGCFSQLFNS